ncbi:MAG TPA: STAS domain-containing protein, partial [Spirochaetota bacterium]|nr:STAS domain-containing protein [Spirochaetota bacterium]
LAITIKEESKNILKINAYGSISSQNSYDMQNEVMKMLKENHHIIFDCRDLTYISSSGIGSLLFIKSKIKKLNGDIFLINPQEKVNSIFSTMGVSDILYQYDKAMSIISDS